MSEEVKDEGIQFFGEVDLTREGKVSSAMPAWYYDIHIDALQEGIDRKERALDRGEIPPTEMAYTKAELKREKERLREIRKSEPVMNAAKRDRCAKVYGELSESISESMFSRSDMNKGLASPHEELRRQKEPTIKCPDVQLAKDANIPVDRQGRMSRDGASKLWKLCGRLTEQATNTEHLRKD